MVGVCSLEDGSEEASESVCSIVGEVMTLLSYSSSASESAYPVPLGKAIVSLYPGRLGQMTDRRRGRGHRAPPDDLELLRPLASDCFLGQHRRICDSLRNVVEVSSGEEAET